MDPYGNNLPETGLTTLTGWVIQADSASLILLDEQYNHTLINREQLVGSIVVLMEQKEMPERVERKVC